MTKPVTARIDAAIWALIFGGMIVFGVGVSLQRGDAATLGWVAAAVGVAAATVGVLLIWVRSRMREQEDPRR